jgi:hypothetical protein
VKKKLLATVLVLIMAISLFPVPAMAANNQNVDLTVTVRDFKADGVLFEGDIVSAEGLVKEALGADKKPVYNLSFGRNILVSLYAE